MSSGYAIIGDTYGADSITVSATYYNSTDNASTGVSKGDIIGVDASKFNDQAYIQGMGFTDANGWLYSGSSVLPSLKSTNLVNSTTTLKEILGNDCTAQTIVVQTSSGVQNIVVSADDSIFENYLRQA